MPREHEKRHSDPTDEAHGTFQEALGQSEAFLTFQERLSRVAQVDRPVLILGERGTGKELAASRLHFLSKRWEEPFVALNCSALTPTLIESELFGHEAGSFTGARERRLGRFETANGGTLFLDEIGAIPVQVQEKILRVVEYGSFERVGGSKSVRVDVRILGATNTDLIDLARKGKFMLDLLDRLSFEVLIIPPLQKRGEDISLLANHFASRMGFELGLPEVPEITEDAMRLLEEYTWPGNVRELKNVIERAVYRSGDTLIEASEIIFDPFKEFSKEFRRSSPGEGADETVDAPTQGPRLAEEKVSLDKPLAEAVQDLELRMLQRGLHEAKFNQRKAAELLGLSYHQFRGLYRKYQDALAE